jgi:hypothetical protein
MPVVRVCLSPEQGHGVLPHHTETSSPAKMI